MNSGHAFTLDALLTRQRPSPAEAVAIVLELCRQVRPATAGAVTVTAPVSRGTVLLDSDGQVATRGAVVEDDQTTSLLGHLLLDLLDERPEAGRIRRIAGRAARSLPGDRRNSVRRLATALRRSAPSDLRAAVRAFVSRATGAEHDLLPPGARAAGPGVLARGAARLLMPWRRPFA